MFRLSSLFLAVTVACAILAAFAAGQQVEANRVEGQRWALYRQRVDLLQEAHILAELEAALHGN